jgi:RNA polymerase sigma-70 factor (ECF subfamily)
LSRFATTRWSLILLAASEDDEEARVALALLCEAYWLPVYALVRRLGASPADAEDVTQGYFARFLEKDVVRQVRPELGRFRAFLLVSVRNFLHNERDKARAEKRGGGRRLLSLDVVAAEERLARSLHETVTPETLFERTWAQTVLARAHERLEEDAARKGGRERFRRLRPFLADEDAEPAYAEIAREWGVGESAVRVYLHRLRKKLAVVLREEIGRTVGSPAEIDEEARFLREALHS